MPLSFDFDIALIGCGYWGKNIARVFAELSKKGIFTGNLILYDKDPQKAAYLAKKYGFIHHNDYRALMENDDIKAILTVTPSSTHYGIARDGLSAGKHVFVEKPFTLLPENAEKLVVLAEKSAATLMVGHIFRYHTALRELKRRIGLGEFGDIMFMMGYRFGYAVPKEDAGVIKTLAVNDFDIFCYLLDIDYPDYISAEKGIFLGEKIEETASICIEYNGRIKGYFLESWLMPVFGRTRELILVGSDKTARINYLHPEQVMIYDVRIEKAEPDSKSVFKMIRGHPQKTFLEFEEPLRVEILHFLECVAFGKKPLTDGKIGYRALMMCEMALESAEKRRGIFVKDYLKERGTDLSSL